MIGLTETQSLETITIINISHVINEINYSDYTYVRPTVTGVSANQQSCVTTRWNKNVTTHPRRCRAARDTASEIANPVDTLLD